MNHEQIIQSLIDKNSYQSYLEIGTQKRKCFNAIKCAYKVGIDPETGGVEGTLKKNSDLFFEENAETFDIIFIDGLHHDEQVEKDILSAINCLNEKGIVVVHDLLPTTEEMQEVPRKVREWTGDGWKAFARIKSEHTGVVMETVDSDYGCGLIRFGQSKKTTISKKPGWTYFEKNKARIMGLITVDEFKEQYLK